MQRETIDNATIRNAVKRARMEGRRIVVRDAQVRAFALRVSATGVYSYTFQYRDRDHVQRLYTLPSEDCETPIDARAAAQKLRKRHKEEGLDPRGERRSGRERQQAEQRARHTIAELCDRWLEDRTDKKSLASDRVLIEAYIKPQLGRFRIDEVTRDDIAKEMDAIGQATPIMANRFHSLVSSLLGYAGSGVVGGRRRDEGPLATRGLGWLDAKFANVATGIGHYKEKKRKRSLSLDELRRFVAALDQYRDTIPGRQVRLLMLTLSRRAEVLGARWSEFALDSKPTFWKKPAKHTKLGEDVYTQIRGDALELLRLMKAEARGRDDDRLFPGGSEASQARALRKFWLDLTAEAGLKDFHLHDLRHVGASLLVSGTPETNAHPLFNVGRVLGHASGSRTTELYSHLSDHAGVAAMDDVSTFYRSARRPRRGRKMVAT